VVFEGAADIGGDAIIGTKLAIHGGLHLYSSLPEREQTFARKCVAYRDKRVGNPKFEGKLKLGEMFFGKTPAVFVYRMGPLRKRCLASRTNG
jgi:hypothetical protein